MLLAWLGGGVSSVALAVWRPAWAQSTAFCAWTTLASCCTRSASNDFWAVRSDASAESTAVLAWATLAALWVRAEANDARAVFRLFSADCTEVRADVFDWIVPARPVLMPASAVRTVACALVSEDAAWAIVCLADASAWLSWASAVRRLAR